jgi:hypothetical protein
MSSVIIAGDTSGTVTLAAPAVAGSTTLTLPATTDTLVGKTTTDTLTNKTLTSPTITGANITVASTAAPAFSAYAATSTSTAAVTATKIIFNTEYFDTNSNFASSRFTPTVAGYYLIGAALNAAGGGSPSRTILDIYKNGSQVKRLFDVQAQAPNVCGCCLINMNGTTDYIEVYAYIIATAPQIYGSSSDTFFTGFLARSA